MNDNFATEEMAFHWNWGAFFFNILFGFANKAWLTFLCFIPVFNIVWIFVCGAKGEKWAWESGEFNNEESFRATMRSWNRAGILQLILVVISLVICLIAYASIMAVLAKALQGYAYF